MQNLAGGSLGPYQVIERIALGGMAAVYLARQPSIDREVAIKVLSLSGNDDSAQIERFDREARLLAGLQNPHILPVFDVGRTADYAYIVSPVLRHGDLAQRLARWGEPLPLADIRRIGLQLCEALACAHANGIVHRDLKPANVLLDENGNCLLTDFGIAKVADGKGLTVVGTLIGTPEYMSPEQGAGKPVDARSDLYCLGTILYELATYTLPFDAPTPTDLILLRLESPPPSPLALNPALPEEFDAVIRKVMAVDPAQRYGSALELADALRGALPEQVEVKPELASTRPMPVFDPRATVAPPAGLAATLSTPLPKPSSSRVPLLLLLAVVAAAAGAWWKFGAPPGVGVPTLNSPPPAPPTAPATPPPQPTSAPAPAETPATAPTTPPAKPTPSANPTPPAKPGVEPTAAPVPDAPAGHEEPRGPDTSAPADKNGTFVGSGTPGIGQFVGSTEGTGFLLLDRFDEDEFEGSYNEARWQPVPGARSTSAKQDNGVLRIATRETLHGLYSTLGNAGLPKVIAVRLRVATAPQAAQGRIGVLLSAYGHGAAAPLWWASCYVQAHAGRTTGVPTCDDAVGATVFHAPDNHLGDWADFELVRHGDALELSVDGKPLGSLPLPASARARGLTWYLSLTGWSSDGRVVTGEVDEVRVQP